MKEAKLDKILKGDLPAGELPAEVADHYHRQTGAGAQELHALAVGWGYGTRAMIDGLTENEIQLVAAMRQLAPGGTLTLTRNGRNSDVEYFLELTEKKLLKSSNKPL
jgi:hypothetical protein